MVYQILHYVTSRGTSPFQQWLEDLSDRSARVAIVRRLNRLEAGNFGDHASCRDGVRELRVDTGPGYRVYFGMTGQHVVLLLCGGDKRRQAADIDRACEYWRDFKRRVHEQE